MKTSTLLKPWSSLFLATFCLVASPQAEPFTVKEDADTLTIRRGTQEVLVYRKTALPLPKGVNPVFARTGYIHPLKTPAGGVVTSVYAPDHYHHLGLWHAWVKTHHGARELDFWNIGGKTAGMRYDQTMAQSEGADSAGFTVAQSQYACDPATGEPAETILDEQLTVTVQDAGDAYLVDYDFTQTNVTTAPLELAAYRYGGGIAYRGPLHWNKDNSRILTSAGHRRADGHATRARWVEMSGDLDTGRGGVVILCHERNQDAPQHVRLWDDGKVFFNYVPAQEHAFSVAPGETVRARYRVVAFDGELPVERIDALWKAYVQDSATLH
ncbi:PmoA family protein [Synoicihabitans lomoniglobus]|uniref:PmoA family protein n=1 Tax=Synoicihabitans lomoniglobus TaxID=2909285 RepID=A0AAE9ZUU6_9BACT|nr:PmoA family protein [Opitutaceae bacterium LMO-M01]WED65535.1 PmoA family protein [Opitutaceae bacterium LMO-M01]